MFAFIVLYIFHVSPHLHLMPWEEAAMSIVMSMKEKPFNSWGVSKLLTGSVFRRYMAVCKIPFTNSLNGSRLASRLQLAQALAAADAIGQLQRVLWWTAAVQKLPAELSHRDKLTNTNGYSGLSCCFLMKAFISQQPSEWTNVSDLTKANRGFTKKKKHLKVLKESVFFSVIRRIVCEGRVTVFPVCAVSSRSQHVRDDRSAGGRVRAE